MSKAPRLAAARRDWGDDDSGTPILHVDMDAFFVEVELRRRPELRGRPVIVGGSSMRGVVSSASYEARAAGVHAGQPIALARRACPDAIVLPTSHGLYGRVSAQVMAILGDFTSRLEPVSVDEAFLDVSGSRRLWGRPRAIADAARERIRSRLGLPASVGIARNKLVAKIASAHAKPDGVLLVPADATVEFLHMLPVGALWGVGPTTQARLASRGIRTVRALAEEPLASLTALLGQAQGARLKALACGHDERPVARERHEKSIGTETTFEVDVTDPATIADVLLDQAHQDAHRLREAGALAQTVSIKVRYSDFSTLTRSRTLPQPTDVARDIAAAARTLFEASGGVGKGVRLVGVRVEHLRAAAAGVQASLLDDPHVREAEAAMDAINSRFGAGKVRPASLLRPRRAGEA